MMSHPNATPAPRYAVEDVEELMTCAAQILNHLNEGTLTTAEPFTDGTPQAVEACDKMEQVLDRLRKSALDNVTGIRPTVYPRAACAIDLPLDFGMTLVAVVCADEFNDLCDSYHQTPAEVLAGFVADACGLDDPQIGYCTGGSDERDQASSYVERRYGYTRLARQVA